MDLHVHGVIFRGMEGDVLGVMCMLGLNRPVHVNSLTLRNPKRPGLERPTAL